jgi:bifunctional ADP-heptose synthase (sugar kinase/adenylyltransferase)
MAMLIERRVTHIDGAMATGFGGASRVREVTRNGSTQEAGPDLREPSLNNDAHLTSTEVQGGISNPLTSLHEKSEIELRQEGVLHCLDQLSEMARNPEARTAEVVAAVEPILDVFWHDATEKPNREGGSETVVNTDPVYNLGGGANVLRGLAPFARTVDAVVRVGTQGPFNGITEAELAKLPDNVRLRIINDPTSVPAVKVRFTGTDGKVFNGVTFQPKPVTADIELELTDQFARLSEAANENTSLVVSDYGRGTMSENVMRAIGGIAEQNPRTRFIVDPRPSKDPEKNKKYDTYGAIPTPNKGEAKDLADADVNGETFEQVQDSARAAAMKTLETYPKLKGVLITCDKDGAHYIGRDGEEAHGFNTVPETHVKNPSGAGDIVVATLALLPEGIPFGDRLQTAMYLAGTSVTYPDTSTLTPELVDEVKKRITSELALRTNIRSLPIQAEVINSDMDGIPGIMHRVHRQREQLGANLGETIKANSRQLVQNGAKQTNGNGHLHRTDTLNGNLIPISSLKSATVFSLS